MGKKLTLEEAKIAFDNNGYVLISQDYNGSKQRLEYYCKKHPEHIQFGQLQHAKTKSLCKYCKSDKLREKHLLSQDFVFAEFLNRGLIPEVNEKYISARLPIQVRCVKHSDKLLKISYSNLSSHESGCRYCFYENNTGENNCNWKGGITELANYLRPYALSWVNKTISEFGYICALSGKTHNLEVHHLTSFSNILKSALRKLDLELKPTISEYQVSDLNLLKQEIFDYHDNNFGVVLNFDIHRLYHKIYGFDNTPEQFEEFKLDYLNNKYSFEGSVA